MPRSLTAHEKRWIDCLLEMGAAGGAAARPLYGTAVGRSMVGRGAGGDDTMKIDKACEDAMLAVLERMAPASSSLVSEEAGILERSGAAWRVVLDPLDGSRNAKRGLEPFCASIGVADGEVMEDLRVAHVKDYLKADAFIAVKGAGLLQVGDGTPPTPLELGHSRYESRLVEVVLLEAGSPDRHHLEFHDLSLLGGGAARDGDMRVRQIGSLALSLCYVATGVADVLLAAVPARSVDIAAGLLILKEAGGGAAALSEADIWLQPLDLEKRCAFVAWRAGLDGAEITQRARRIKTVLRGG